MPLNIYFLMLFAPQSLLSYKQWTGVTQQRPNIGINIECINCLKHISLKDEASFPGTLYSKENTARFTVGALMWHFTLGRPQVSHLSHEYDPACLLKMSKSNVLVINVDISVIYAFTYNNSPLQLDLNPQPSGYYQQNHVSLISLSGSCTKTLISWPD